MATLTDQTWWNTLNATKAHYTKVHGKEPTMNTIGNILSSQKNFQAAEWVYGLTDDQHESQDG